MSHWTLALCGFAIVAALVVLLRRPEPVTPDLAPEQVSGVPEVSPMLDLVEAESERNRSGMIGRWRRERP
jgi:hypothetical protein